MQENDFQKIILILITCFVCFRYQNQMVRQIRRGYDGIDEDPNRVRWTIPSALMYCITIYTTIGSLFFAFCLCLFSFLNNFCPFFRFFFLGLNLSQKRLFLLLYPTTKTKFEDDDDDTAETGNRTFSLFSLGCCRESFLNLPRKSKGQISL